MPVEASIINMLMSDVDACGGIICTHNAGVEGSSPSLSTNEISSLVLDRSDDDFR